MNDIITIALKAFPVIALITTGVVLEKTAFISAEAVKGMKKLIMNLALPCLLFLILLDADLQTDYLWGSVAVFLTCLVALAMGFLFKKMPGCTLCSARSAGVIVGAEAPMAPEFTRGPRRPREGNLRGMFSRRPPPVMWASALIRPARISGRRLAT